MASYNVLVCLLVIACSLVGIDAETAKAGSEKGEVLKTAEAGYYYPGYNGYGRSYGYTTNGYKSYASYPYNIGYPYSTTYSFHPYGTSEYPYNQYQTGYYPYNQYQTGYYPYNQYQTGYYPYNHQYKGYYPYNTVYTQLDGYDDGKYHPGKYGGSY